MAETITGTDGDEDLIGTDADEVFLAGGGQDAVDAYGGDDTVFGEGGDDILGGGDGDDAIYGGAGDDTMIGGMVGSSDFDIVDGGAGNDLLYFSAGGIARGGEGEDRLNYINFDAAGVRLAISISGAPAVIDNPGGLTVDSIESLHAQTGWGDDRIRGGDLIDYMDVGGGANRIWAYGGDDVVGYRMGQGNLIRAGEGHDLVSVLFDNAGAVFTVAADGSATDSFGSRVLDAEYFWLFGGEGDDQATLGGGNDIFYGGVGNDAAAGGAGADDLKGGFTGRDSGSDTLSGEAGDDELAGGKGDDALTGGDGIDRLNGADGADRLDGGAGRDHLNGGQGADRFEFTVLDRVDGIRDFGGDDLIAIDDAAIGGVIGPGALDPGRFALEGADRDDGQFVYSHDVHRGTEYGVLSWIEPEADGGESIVIARLSGAPALTAGDIEIF